MAGEWKRRISSKQNTKMAYTVVVDISFGKPVVHRRTKLEQILKREEEWVWT